MNYQSNSAIDLHGADARHGLVVSAELLRKYKRLYFLGVLRQRPGRGADRHQARISEKSLRRCRKVFVFSILSAILAGLESLYTIGIFLQYPSRLWQTFNVIKILNIYPSALCLHQYDLLIWIHICNCGSFR